MGTSGSACELGTEISSSSSHSHRRPFSYSGRPAARKAGADVFLQKPQGVAALVETINRLLSARTQETKRFDTFSVEDQSGE